jgi:hypothetical protein
MGSGWGKSTEILERSNMLMFPGRTSLVVTALCALIGVVAFVSLGVLTLTGGSEYMEFALVMVFFVCFVVGSYWWIVSGPGRYL